MEQVGFLVGLATRDLDVIHDQVGRAHSVVGVDHDVVVSEEETLLGHDLGEAACQTPSRHWRSRDLEMLTES